MLAKNRRKKFSVLEMQILVFTVVFGIVHVNMGDGASVKNNNFNNHLYFYTMEE
ncbi:MAG: hypothetical protein QMC80_02095 [Thermoplasmatales archaeon]|nr:hypothetical protein [Thermoplasmatales archaeon]